MSRERGTVGWIALGVAIVLVLLVIGLVQLLIPGDADDDDEDGYVRVEFAMPGQPA